MPPAVPSIEHVLAEAVEIASAEERAAYLERACGPDAALRTEVERLIANHFRAGPFLEVPAAVVRPEDFATPLEGPGTQVGPYRLLELIGEGGMGAVYLAEQTEPIRRQVALKLIKPGMDSKQVIARFEAERQALALMDHPNIAHVLDAGTTDTGRPFFVMDLVRGEPITTFCDRTNLTVPDRLALFIPVCQAVQHAHTKGVIHRDLKPANVLVTAGDGAAVPKVIDFGVAKALREPLTGQSLHTGQAQVVGTPLYMSPEQADLSEAGVDTRSDVYSLGVLLYELLTGRTPFDKARLQAAGFDELRRALREEDPPRPSKRLAASAPARAALVRDLDWVVLRALEKDRECRYQSPSDLAADLQRFLAGEPVQACPPSRRYRLARFVRRHKAALVVAAAVALALIVCVAAVVGALVVSLRHNEEMSESLAVSNRLRDEAEEREGWLRRELYASDMTRARHSWENGDLEQCRALLARHMPGAGEAGRRGFEWGYLWNCCQSEVRALCGQGAPLLSLAISPNERLLASGDRGGAVAIWELATGKKVRELRYGKQEVMAVRFSPDGRWLATAGQDTTVRLWATANWAEIACLRGHDRTVCAVAWSPDGKWLASAGRDQQVVVWEVATRRKDRSLGPEKDVIRCVEWSPNGRWLAAGCGNEVLLWDARTWHGWRCEPSHDGGVLALAFSPDSESLASGGYGYWLAVHDVAQRKVLANQVRTDTNWSLTYSQDGRMLIAGLANGRARLWELAERARDLRPPLGLATGPGNAVRGVAFAHGGRTLATLSDQNRTVQLWDFARLRGHRFLPQPPTKGWLAVHPSRDVAALLGADGRVELRSLRTGTVRAVLGQERGAISAAFGPGGARVALGFPGGEVALWDVATARPLRRWNGPRHPFSLAFSADDALLAAVGEQGDVSVWLAETGAVRMALPQGAAGPDAVAFSPDGTTLAVSATVSGATLYDLATGLPRATLRAAQRVLTLAFSPDGQQLAGGGGQHGVLLWQLPEGKGPSLLAGHFGEVTRVRFFPGGRTLVSSGSDGTVRLWHVPLRRELYTLLRRPQAQAWVEAASEGLLLVGNHVFDPAGAGVWMFEAAYGPRR